jgi:hypothetical protein
LISTINAAPSASTFVLPQRGWNFTFSLNVDKNSDDIYFRFISSADYSWAAVGIGPRMKGSLMFVAYQGKDSKGSSSVHQEHVVLVIDRQLMI